MFLELERVPPEGQAVDRVIGVASIPAVDEEFRLVSDVVLAGRLELLKPLEPLEEEGATDAGAFRLRGTLSCQIEVQCVRCLEPFRSDVGERLDLLFLPQSRNRAASGRDGVEDDRGLDSEELAVSFYRDNQIDLGQMIREQVLLSLPMKPLCKEECRGLCPECGANRNIEDCDCAPQESDPRWSTLKSLLGR